MHYVNNNLSTTQFNNVTCKNINKTLWFMCVQYCLARVVLKDNYNSATPSCLNFTGFQSVNELISKLLHMHVAFGQPTYHFSSVLTPRKPQRSLHSVNQNLLSVQCCNSSFGQRSFSYCAPKIWNDIPLSIRHSPSLDSCRSKTHYFANIFNWPPGDCLQYLWLDILDIVCFANCYEWMNESAKWTYQINNGH